MQDVRFLNTIFTQKSILTIPGNASFTQIFKKIKRSKNADFVFVEKPIAQQMAATLVSKLSGRKFFWLQGFENPPTPNFVTRLLLNQADRVLIKDKGVKYKLKKIGVAKEKIRFQA